VFRASSSGEGDDDYAKRRQAWRRRAKPENEIPVTVGTSILLGRSDELAVAISDLRVFRNGVEFTVSARCRGRLARRGVLHMGLSRHPHPRQAELAEPFLLGFELADGRTVTNLAPWPPDLDESGDDDDGPWLTNSGGGGSDRSADHAYFLAPLPPGDTLVVIAAWPGLGIEESRHVLDARAIRAAADQVIELWPAEPDDDDDLEPPPPPHVPPGSWFDRN
jgi:hypothetical protein